MSNHLSRRGVIGGTLASAVTAARGTSAVSASAASASPSTPSGDEGHDDPWHAILADSDPVWQSMPASWDEGPFLGNALLGTGIYAEPQANAVRFTVQHSEVQDHRPEFGSLFGLGRLPVGAFTLDPVGTITGVDWRLDLWNAELGGSITTTAGRLDLRALIHSARGVLAVEVTPSPGEAGFGWTYHPAVAISPRAAFKTPPPGYAANPPAITGTYGTANTAVQNLTAGGGHTTAWKLVRRGSGQTLYAAVAHSFPSADHLETAVRTATEAARLPVTELVHDHRCWWNAFYRKSFLSIPDARLQSFYWIQLYKVGSAARREAPVMATTGPWLEPTPWPASWWNLNVQLEYWLINGSNHLELDGLTQSLSQYRENLRGQVVPQYQHDSLVMARSQDTTLTHGIDDGSHTYAVAIPGEDPPIPEAGNLTWALHNVWLGYRHSMDAAILRETLYPMLRQAINYYLHFLALGDDGAYHLPKTFSPEYGVDTPDTNYDLALLRWGCATLLDCVQILGVDDPLAARWHDVLARITPYPTDENGFMIGAGQPFAKSHRHYSHMLSVYPLYLVNWEQPEHRDLIQTSVQHWISFTGALQGYSYTGAASFAAQMLDGDAASGYLAALLSEYIRPNTMYKESGPVIETPLSAAQSIHDMLCQSWGDVIRVFPAVPSSWKDVALHQFRTQGAFLLSASRKNSVTQWVRLYSEAGSPCVVRTDLQQPLEVRDEHGRPLPHTDLGDGTLRIDLPGDSSVLLYPSGTDPDLTVVPVAANGPAPRWGLPLADGGTV